MNMFDKIISIRLTRYGRGRRSLIRSSAMLALVALTGSVLVGVAAPPAFAACGPGCGPYPVTGSKPSSITAGPDGSMWFTEEAKDKIGRISPSGQLKTFDVPTSQAWPNSIAAGPDGNLWFVEPGAPSKHPINVDQIGRITPKGVITEFPVHDFGTGAPSSIVAGPDGSLWFTELFQSGYEIDAMSTSGALVAENPVTGDPTDITAGPDGNLWFTEGNGDIGQITTSGSITYFTVPDSLVPIDIAPGADGALWFTTYSNTIGRITTGGAITLYTVPTDGEDTYSWGVSPGPDGNIWVTLYGTDQLARVNTQPGMIGEITVYDVPVSGETAGPYGIATGVNGDVWFTDLLAGEIVDFPVSPVVSQDPVSATANGLYGTTAGPNGDDWFTDYANSQVDRICQNGSQQAYNVPTSGGAAYGITEGPWPHRFTQDVVGIWFTEPVANRIGVIPESVGPTVGQPCPTLTPTDFAIPTAGAGLRDLTWGPDGAVWFTEFNADKIGRITDTGAVTEYSLPTAGADPLDIASGPDGNLWFTEWGANQIGRITPAGVVTEFPIPTAGSGPAGITAGPDGNLWFTEANANQIGRITTGGVVNEYPIPTSESYPGQIVAGPDGNLWFGEDHAAQIASITTSGTVTEFSLGEAEDPDAIAATYGGLIVGDRNNGAWSLATVDPPGSNAVVLPSGPVPSTSTVAFGSSLTWTQLAPAAQNIADATGMNLYTSATLGNDVGSTYSYRFTAAGTYPYIAAPVGVTTANGTVKVPIQVAPTQTNTNHPVTITWASTPAPFGYAYDVQVKEPGGSYKTWIAGTTTTSSAFSADSTPGYYVFRARLRNTSSGAQSGWSPAAEFQAV
jgi:streptogramin lyase